MDGEGGDDAVVVLPPERGPQLGDLERRPQPKGDRDRDGDGGPFASEDEQQLYIAVKQNRKKLPVVSTYLPTPRFPVVSISPQKGAEPIRGKPGDKKLPYIPCSL